MKSLSQFRLISLVGCICNFLAKALACRLRVTLKEVIGETQGAFVEDRQILDGVLIVNRVIHIRKRDRKRIFYFKWMWRRPIILLIGLLLIIYLERWVLGTNGGSG